MPSITAMFLFNGFNSFIAASSKDAKNINFIFSEGGQADTARLLQNIADGIDQRVAVRQATFPGVWEYDVVEPFGSALADLTARGKVLTVREMVDLLDLRTEEWIAEHTPESSSVVRQKHKTDAMPEGRDSVIAITNNADCERGIHFVQHSVLSGSNHNLWFPIGAEESWFTAIERILIMNGIAENVTAITCINEKEEYQDFKIIFNRRVE